MINDLLLEPQNKVNHIAMLNTLYPPVTDKTKTPTPQLTPQHMKTQRDGYFRYINAVATHGKVALEHVILQGAPEGESTAWPKLHDCLLRYLSLVNKLIDECLLVSEPSYLSECGSPYRNKGRKVDSGISFTSSDVSIAEGEEKPLPQFPLPKPNAKTGSFLERIAREVRSLGPNARAKNLKKMKSTTALNSRPGSQHSYAESSFFEIDDQKRRRLIGEATNRKTSQSQLASFT